MPSDCSWGWRCKPEGVPRFLPPNKAMADPARKDARKEIATVEPAVRFVLCPMAGLLGEFEGDFVAVLPFLLLFLLPSRGVGGGYVGDGELGP